ncbi:hypothetical protein FEM48_Zijuj07G0058400 [Ziziphus jujuba var. spinosa]|uniref:Uncharacterized protein n=1 Tax=Ziziphus jujuba var. spinosa TaxID=714518 RepID=A0A978V2U5_ZIZJJ|nr:hypothetical protein FEM48_Zijuj07G0058400 [Ziziphus jujuba var. spinosa]
MVDSFHENDNKIAYKSAISDSYTDHNVVEELHELMLFQTKVFIAHMSEVLVSKLLLNVKGLGIGSIDFSSGKGILDSNYYEPLGFCRLICTRFNARGEGFSKGPPSIQDMSQVIHKLRQTGKIAKLEKKWFGNCMSALATSKDSENDPHSLNLDSYWGLFPVTGISLTFALFLFFAFSINEKMDGLKDYKFAQLIIQLQILRRYRSKKVSDGNNNVIT